jgi:hypothetical protein
MPGGFGLVVVVVVVSAAGVNVDVGVGGGEACRAGDSGDIGAAWRLIRADDDHVPKVQVTRLEVRLLARGSR